MPIPFFCFVFFFFFFFSLLLSVSPSSLPSPFLQPVAVHGNASTTSPPSPSLVSFSHPNALSLLLAPSLYVCLFLPVCLSLSLSSDVNQSTSSEPHRTSRAGRTGSDDDDTQAGSLEVAQTARWHGGERAHGSSELQRGTTFSD